MKDLPKTTIRIPNLGRDHRGDSIFVTFPPGTIIFDNRNHAFYFIITPAKSARDPGWSIDVIKGRSWKLSISKFVSGAVLNCVEHVIETGDGVQRMKPKW